MSILNHVWGVSPAADRVWAQISGMAPSLAADRLLMVLHAYFDESFTGGGVFVLGGYISSAERWAIFAKDWEEMLPHSTLKDDDGRSYFKMSRMTSADKMERTQAFYRIIENNVMHAFSISFNIADFVSVRESLSHSEDFYRWGAFESTNSFAYRMLMDAFHKECNNNPKLSKLVAENGAIDIILDNHSNKNDVISSWDEYVRKRPPEWDDVFGVTPRFENDNVFLPLQAADFWVWWVRERCEKGGPAAIGDPKFGTWLAKVDLPITHAQIEPRHIEKFLRGAIADVRGF